MANGADRPGDQDQVGPELAFALVYPVGTDADMVIRRLSASLREANYDPHPIHLIDRLPRAGDESDIFDEYMAKMDAGNALRKKTGRNDVFALQCAAAIHQARSDAFGEQVPIDQRIFPRKAFIIRSLKRPEEVETLRAIYGAALILVAAHSPLRSRSDRLTWEISKSGRGTESPESRRPDAERLIARDESEALIDEGQRVTDTFPLADVFLDASHPERLQANVDRFIEILFGHPFHTPTRMEYGMFHAQGAALCSSDLSRQVGAAIADPDGQIIALGTNEVPKPGGGPYWEGGGQQDRRDFTFGDDVSTELKKRALRQVLEALHESHKLTSSPDEIIDNVWGELRGTVLMNVGEFGRGVHAEMAAIVDASRRGVSVRNTTLYTTTFPCHVCARHIVDAGIPRVVYNEPYPKSMARFLHMDSIVVDEGREEVHRTNFVPFVGLAPHLYVELFRLQGILGGRKRANGQVVDWVKGTSNPRRYETPTRYIPREASAVELLADASTEVEPPPEPGPETSPSSG
jgi:deoxycytidylate deaminase